MAVAVSVVVSLAVSLAVMTALSGPASAHVALLFTAPVADGAVPISPAELTLTFDSMIVLPADPVTVTGPDDGWVALGRAVARKSVLTVPVAQTLRPGVYAVAWQVIGDDGDAVTGRYRFAVGPRPPASALAAEGCVSPSAGPGLWPTVVLRWLGRVVPAAQRPAAPAISGPSLTGQPLSVDRPGQVTVINVWGSWCVPCRTEMPILQAIAAETRPLGVRFVGVNTRDDRAAAQAFARRYRVSWPSIFDPDGTALAHFGPLAPRAFPTTYLIDARHRIAAVYFGVIRYSDFKPAVAQVATER